MKKYLDIDVNSTYYSKLPKEEQLRVVKEKLNNLFNNKQVKTITVKYNGTWKTVPSEMSGVYKDLCDREKSLQKRVKIDFTYDSDKVITDVISEPKKSYITPSTKDISFDELNIDERIKIVKSKMFDIFDLAERNENTHTNIYKVSYKGNTKFVPYALWGDYSKLRKVLDDLERQKREIEARKVATAKNDYDVKGDDGDDLCDVWNKAFEKRDERKQSVEVVKTEKNECPVLNSVKDDSQDVSHESEAVLKNKEENILEIAPVLTDVKDDSQDFVCVSKNKEENLKKADSSSGIIKMDASKNESIRPLVFPDYITGSTNKNSSDSKEYSEKKTSRKSLFSGLLTIPFVQKIVERRKKKKEMSTLEKQKRRKEIKTTFVALALAAVAIVTGVFGGINKKKTEKNDRKEEVSTVCQPSPKEAHTEEERQMIVDYYMNNSNSEKHYTTDVVVEDNEQINNVVRTDNEISFGDTVNVSSDAYIYTNCYDAAATTNGLTPYFAGTMEREVTGVVYNLNGNLFYLYSNDIHSKENEEKLLEQGATKVAYLVGNYEGYYNANDVYKKVKTMR